MYLTPDKQLISDQWYDQPDAHDHIENNLHNALSADMKERLHKFVDDGYLILESQTDQQKIEALKHEIDRMWDKGSAPVIFGAQGIRTLFKDLDTQTHRQPGYRLPDLHGYSSPCMDLVLSEEIFALLDVLFGEPAIGFQTLYFEWGSQQGLHRDPMFVRTEPPSMLLASWLALEDIHPDSGPLCYVPGSHRFPWYEFVEGDVTVNKSEDGPDKRRAFKALYQQHMKDHGRKVEHFTPKQGDILIWHGSLLHGGSAVKDHARTRKSIVTHYAPKASRSHTSNNLKLSRDGKVQTFKSQTAEMIERNGGAVFDAPLPAEKLSEFLADDTITNAL